MQKYVSGVGYVDMTAEEIAAREAEIAAIPEKTDLDRTLTRRQVIAALIVGANVTSPDAAVEAAIQQIPDALQRALALNDWRNAPYYARTHALFNDEAMLTAMGMTPGQVDELWLLGLTLPR